MTNFYVKSKNQHRLLPVLVKQLRGESNYGDKFEIATTILRDSHHEVAAETLTLCAKIVLAELANIVPTDKPYDPSYDIINALNALLFAHRDDIDCEKLGPTLLKLLEHFNENIERLTMFLSSIANLCAVHNFDALHTSIMDSLNDIAINENILKTLELYHHGLSANISPAISNTNARLNAI